MYKLLIRLLRRTAVRRAGKIVDPVPFDGVPVSEQVRFRIDRRNPVIIPWFAPRSDYCYFSAIVQNLLNPAKRNDRTMPDPAGDKDFAVFD